MNHQFETNFSSKRFFFIVGEGIAIYLALSLSFFLFFKEDMGLMRLINLTWIKIVFVVLIVQASLYLNDLYKFNEMFKSGSLAIKVFQSVGISAAILVILYYLKPDQVIGIGSFLTGILFLIVVILLWRLLCAFIITRKLFLINTILIGSGEFAKDLFREIYSTIDVRYKIKSVIFPDKSKKFPITYEGVSVNYGFHNLCELAEREKASCIMVALDEKRGILPYDELLKCETKGINVVYGEKIYEKLTGKVLIEKIDPSWFIFPNGIVKSGTFRLIERFMGIVFSIMIIILLLPFLILIAIAIKIDSHGPAIFTQTRAGKNEKTFTFYKFRSMIVDAEKDTGPMWATFDDPRITRVGKVIRKLHIDELPQLWNVLKGEMNIIGPRPERPFFVEKLKKSIPYYHMRHTVKLWPQITVGLR